MRKLLYFSFIIFTLMLTDLCWAGDKKPRKKRKSKPAKNKVQRKTKPVLEIFTVTGVVSKTVVNDQEVYILTTPSGKIISLPAFKESGKEPAEGVPEEIDIREYENKKVAIFGKGFSRLVEKSSQRKISIKKIINIRIVAETDKKQDSATNTE